MNKNTTPYLVALSPLALAIILALLFSGCASKPKPPVVVLPPVVAHEASAKPAIKSAIRSVDLATVEAVKTVIKVVEIKDNHAAALVLAKSIELRTKDVEITKLREMIEADTGKLKELQEFSERTQVALSNTKDYLTEAQEQNAAKERENQALRARNESLRLLAKSEVETRERAEEARDKANLDKQEAALSDKVKIESLKKYRTIVFWQIGLIVLYLGIKFFTPIGRFL